MKPLVPSYRVHLDRRVKLFKFGGDVDPVSGRREFSESAIVWAAIESGRVRSWTKSVPPDSIVETWVGTRLVIRWAQPFGRPWGPAGSK